MNTWKTRAASLLLALCLLAGTALAAAPGAEAAITISSAGQLEAFAKNCSLDTWSQGKTVRLAADLDLEGRDFTPIPTFGGIFLGEGHKITNLRIEAAGSNMGLFRCLQEGAVVQDLYVAGSVRPSGSAVNVGGIVGSNAGAVRNCNFQGTVEGSSAVGGIAGLNRETGEIARTITAGAVSGEEFTGGTAGRNLGALLQCENGASVNTATPDEDAAVDMDSLTLSLEETPGEGDADGGFLKSHSDTGGIAGYSSGAVYGCLNTGTVGYPHVGYNVGGVAGRQSGHLDRCVNQGTVYGRKDVGGVVGQTEPDIAFSSKNGTLERLRRELDTLETLIERTLDRSEGNGEAVSARLSAMGLTTDEARRHTENLLDSLAGFTDENINSVNGLSASVTRVLGDLTPALEELSDVSGRVECLAERLEKALDALGNAAEGGADVSAGASLAAGIFRRAGEALSAAVRDLRSAVVALESAVVIHDQAAADAALADLSRSLEDFGAGLEQAAQAAEALHEALEAFPDLGGVRDILKGQLVPALAGMGGALKQAGGALKTLRAGVGLDWAQIRAALKESGAGFQELGNASKRLNEAIAALQNTLGSLGGLSGRLGGAIRQLGDAVSLAAPVGRGLERAFGILGSAAARLAEDGPTQLAPLDGGARDAGQGLFDSLADLSQELKGIHETVSGAGEQLASDLRSISRQFSAVFEVLLDVVSDVREGGGASRELVEDTSDEDIAATRMGKVENCRNEAAVDGDRNVGGILGAMSIEYGLDPEGDLELSLGGTYETKAVLQNCVNWGPITAKKDCAGGLAGRMDLGTALGCENYGPVSSTSGSYVGGVAGYAEGVVRDSFAKCALSGVNDVGGAAGWADRLVNCYAIATVLEGTERVGAVAGSGELENMEGNFFVDLGVAGVDGVSYAGRAESISFEALRALPDIPAEFAAFTLTLKAGEKVIKEIPFTYGQDLSKIQLPPVPEREGAYGSWPEFDASGRNSDITLEAVYTPWVTLVASAEQEGRLSLALAEGQFTEEAVLHVRPASETDGTWWEVTLTGTDLGPEDEVKLRLLNRTGGAAEVREFRDGWSQTPRIDAEVNGSYLIITMTGTSGTFQVVPARGNGPLRLALPAAVLLVLLALIRMKKRKTGKPAGEGRETDPLPQGRS